MRCGVIFFGGAWSVLWGIQGKSPLEETEKKRGCRGLWRFCWLVSKGLKGFCIGFFGGNLRTAS